jgi:hypothetical protein
MFFLVLIVVNATVVDDLALAPAEVYYLSLHQLSAVIVEHMKMTLSM